MESLKGTISNLRNIGKEYIASNQSHIKFLVFRDKEWGIYEKLAKLTNDLSLDDLAKVLNNTINSSERNVTLNKIEKCLLRSAVFPDILNKTKESERHIYQNIRKEWWCNISSVN
jgi:hypothetical protein